MKRSSQNFRISPLVAAVSLLFCVSCKSDTPTTKPVQVAPPTPSTDDTPQAGGPVSAGTYSANKSNDGFGSAVAISGEKAWASAPHGDEGAVYRLGTATVSVLSGADRLGTSLVAYGDAFIVGTPLAKAGEGQVVNHDGDVLIGGGGSLGISLWSNESEWIAAQGDGWVDSQGVSTTTIGRPSSLAKLNDSVGVGSAFGEYALQVDGNTFERIAPRDEAGFALAAGDIDNDNQNEWLLGAPGANAVYVIDQNLNLETTIQGSGGRFGSALAVADVDGDGIDDLVVGAPAVGDTVYGEAYLYSGGQLSSPAASWQGSDDGAQLGFSVAATTGWVVMGAPGSASVPGSVLVASP